MQRCPWEKQLNYKPMPAIVSLGLGNFPFGGLFLNLLLASSVHSVLVCRHCRSLGRESRGVGRGASLSCSGMPARLCEMHPPGPPPPPPQAFPKLTPYILNHDIPNLPSQCCVNLFEHFCVMQQ